MLKYLVFFLTLLVNVSASGWHPCPALFDDSVKGAFIGSCKNFIIIAGGEKGDELSDAITLVELGKDRAFRKIDLPGTTLPKKLAYGAAVPHKNGLFCIGGIDKNGFANDVYFIKLDPSNRMVEVQIHPPLPYPLAYASGGIIDHSLYLLGGISSKTPLRENSHYLKLELDLLLGATWEIAGYFPAAARKCPAVTMQSNGLRHCLYVFGGSGAKTGQGNFTDVFMFDPVDKQWRELSPMESSDALPIVAPVGSNSVLMGSDAFYLYNTVTNKWYSYSNLPEPNLSDTSLLKLGNSYLLFAPKPKDGLWISSLDTTKTYSQINYTFLVGYIALLLGLAYFFSKRGNSSEAYFKGRYRIPWWAAGLSIFGTVVNSLSFMVSPAKAFASDWQYLILEMTLILVAPIIIYSFIPFYRRLNVSTAYEYLERRFDFSIRLLGSSIFILFEVLRIGIYLYLPALVLSLLTGLPMELCIICMGILSVIYVSMGGIEAVIWSDIFQVAILIGGALMTLGYIVYHYYGDLPLFYEIAKTEGKIRIFDFSFDFSRPTFWVILLAGISFDIMDYGTDQITVQRYLTTKDEGSAVKSLWLNVVLCSIGGAIFFALGTALFAIYKVYPEKIDPTMPIIDGLLPSFIVTELPQGVSGLLMTGVFVAAMSSIHSGINGISSALTNDFFRPLLHRKGDAWILKLAKLSTAVVGCVGMLFAILMTKLKIISLLDHYIVIVGFTLCGLSGVFLLGIFTTLAHKRGILFGIVATLFSSLMIARYTNIHSLLYMFFSTAGVVVFGYLGSLFIPSKEKSSSQYTIHQLLKSRYQDITD